MTALGVTLLVIGVAVILAEAHVPALGMLGGPGVVLLAVGAILAVSGLGGGILVGVLAAAMLAASGAGVVTLTLRKGLAVRRRRISAGPERMLGHLGTVRKWSQATGTVQVDGALWKARRSWSEEQEAELEEGDEVVVEGLDGLTLRVRRAEDWELVR